MRSYWWKLLQWFSDTPYRSLDRAYKASKRIQSIRKDSLSYIRELSSSRYSWQAVIFYMNMEFNNSAFIIYWSLLECKFSISVLNIQNNWKLIFPRKFPRSSSVNNDPFPFDTNGVYSERDSFGALSYLSNILFFLLVLLREFRPIHFDDNETNENPNEINGSSEDESQDNFYPFAEGSMSGGSSRIKRMNRKIAWIEATLNDLHIRRQSYYLTLPSFRTNDDSDEDFSVSESRGSSSTTIPYESISLVPRSITRTLSRFETELASQSSSLVLNEFQLAKSQALSSIQYIGCLLFLPFIIPIFSKRWFLEPWIKNWWNTSQSQIFINPFQEERALERLQEVEGLLWLDKVMTDPVNNQSQDSDIDVYDETIQLVMIYNEGNIQIILHLLTDVISIVTLILLFIIGRKRLAVLNSWIQELFYSLSDTMKAFSILLLTDLCIGFHSPHGWEIAIGSFLEHSGFAHNKYVISCFVSTFPVIPDTVSKYWIFRHSNRISPSIVATYHTMNE
uniref:Potassium/proton antiporter CemA n=1 Tax=Osmunda mildei TaxID=569351 RepID=A0A8K1VXD7_9MONI|nr:chloroplast envelope membrane protein [Osmunda mildei]